MDDNQPLEFLSEMRQVTIVFINIVSDDQITNSKWEQCKMLQSAFDVIYPITNALHGK